MTASIWAPRGFSPEVVPLNFFEFVATSGQTTFSIAPFTALYDSQVKVWVAGQLLATSSWSLSSTNIILATGATAGQAVRIDVYESSPASDLELPSQAGHATKNLTTDGSSVSWEHTNASNVTVTPVGSLSATNVQSALQELDTEVQNPVFLRAASGAVSRTLNSKLTDIFSVKDFGAIGDGIADDTVALESCIAEGLLIGGCTVYLPRGTYKVVRPIVLPSSVCLRGDGAQASVISKTTATTKAVTIVAPTLAIYNGSALPANINAVLVLDGTAGRYVGKVTDVGFASALSTASKESQIVEFGVVSVGSCSDTQIERTAVTNCTYGYILPDIFASVVSRNKAESCLHGFGIEAGTSLLYTTNYANNCRTYGHFIRGVSYATIMANACDYLNRYDWYPTRSNWCRAYVFSSLHGCTVQSNGQEVTNGIGWYFDGFDHSKFIANYSSNMTSDYSGSNDIAWIYSTYLCRGSEFKYNTGYFPAVTGYLFGAANSAKHHNVFFEGTSFLDRMEFGDNIYRDTYTGTISEGGWTNNTFSTWLAGSLVYNAPSIAAGASVTTVATVTGASLGDYVAVSVNTNLLGLTLTAYVSSSNNVTLVLYNGTGGAIDLPSATFKFKVTQQQL